MSERDDDEDENLFPEGAECHGLFLPESEKDNPVAAEVIGRISVKRIHPWDETALSTYGPTELRSPADLAERWGGGVYQVVARRSDGTILPGATRRVTLNGKAYPFAPGAREKVEAAEAASAHPVVVAPAAPTTADPTVVLMLATLERMAKDADAARKETSAVLVKALDVLATRASSPPAVVTTAAMTGEEKSKDHFVAGMTYAFDQVKEWKKQKGGSDDETEEGNGAGEEHKTIQLVVEGIKAARDLNKE